MLPDEDIAPVVPVSIAVSAACFFAQLAITVIPARVNAAYASRTGIRVFTASPPLIPVVPTAMSPHHVVRLAHTTVMCRRQHSSLAPVRSLGLGQARLEERLDDRDDLRLRQRLVER